MTLLIDQRTFEAKLAAMSALQDKAALLVLPQAGELLNAAKLCGGTALSRFYLQHRLSDDLDFFVPEGIGFDAQALASSIAAKVPIYAMEMTHDRIKADQLHFIVNVGDDPVKISFMEDMYADAFPAVNSSVVIGERNIQTEPIDGLYHRKLRTVVGWADSHAKAPAGGRQTARDMFDLFVLTQARTALKPFIESLAYAFPITAFEDGLASMPWFDLVAELSEMIAAPQWQGGLNVETLQRHLYGQIGMTELPSDDADAS